MPAWLPGPTACSSRLFSYTPLFEDEVYEHFAAVASTTKFTITNALLSRLTEIPNASAIKNALAGGDFGDSGEYEPPRPSCRYLYHHFFKRDVDGIRTDKVHICPSRPSKHSWTETLLQVRP